MRSGKSSVHENSFWNRIRAVCWGSAAGAAVIMLLILLLTVLFVKMRRVPQAAAVPLTIAAASVGSLVSGYVAGRISQQKGILYGFSAALLLFALLFLCGVIIVRETLAPAMSRQGVWKKFKKYAEQAGLPEWAAPRMLR